MREILFRGKEIYGRNDNLKHGIMRWGSLFIDIKGQPKIKWYNSRFGSTKTSNVDPDTVGQFTGQYDAGGSHIFEGDIVYCAKEDENAVIEWNDDASRFQIVFDGWVSDFDSFYGRDLEIIGNIHDNPELMEDNND